MNNRSIGYTEIRDLNTAWHRVLHLGTRRHFRKGELVESKEVLCFLDKGKVRLTHTSLDGQEKILWYIGAGCIFGETPFLDPMPSPGESKHMCVVPCDIYTFTHPCVHNEILPNHPDLMLNLMHSLARKVRILSNQASSLCVDDVLIRICKFLGPRVVPGSDPLRVRPGISRQDMAGLLGVHRITLYKVLKQQEENGLFGIYDQEGIVVLQPDLFWELVQV